MELDLQFYIPQDLTQTYQALEFDPDVTWPDSTSTEYSHKISVSCELHPTNDSTNPSGTPEWEYWDSSADAWEPFWKLGNAGPNGITSYIPCNLSTGRHQLEVYATLDTANHEYYYNEMILDLQQPLFNVSQGSGLGPVQACDPQDESGPCYNFSQYIGVEQQVDNNAGPASSPVCNPNSTTTVCAYYDHYSLVVW